MMHACIARAADHHHHCELAHHPPTRTHTRTGSTRPRRRLRCDRTKSVRDGPFPPPLPQPGPGRPILLITLLPAYPESVQYQPRPQNT